MKTYTLFQEYTWLVDVLHRVGPMTLEEINQRWLRTEMSEGVSIARSTFNRHRDAILDIFGIVIECDRRNGFKYYIYNEEELEQDSIQNWMLSTLSVNSVLSESKGVHGRILLQSIPSDGDKLHMFIEAMKRGVRVMVNYRRYGTELSNSSMKLDPYFVKLFNRRWYAIVKYPEPTGNLFTLALDRVVSMELTDDKFKYQKDFDPARWFRDCYGIVRDPEVPVEKVVIRAFGKEANYMRDLPLHASQVEIDKADDHSDFELRLRPTEDFYTPLLSRGKAIKILEPQWLADEIKSQHQAALELYK